MKPFPQDEAYVEKLREKLKNPELSESEKEDLMDELEGVRLHYYCMEEFPGMGKPVPYCGDPEADENLPERHADKGKRFYRRVVRIQNDERPMSMGYCFAVAPGESKEVVEHMSFTKLVAERIKGCEHLAQFDDTEPISRTDYLQVGSGFRYETNPPDTRCH